MIYEALRALDVDVRDYRVAGYKGRAIAPLGALIHHTASSAGSGDLPSLSTCVHGRPDLPGPLCQVLIGRAGTVAVVTDGWANHAGEGQWAGITSGNGQLVGVEIENDGCGEPFTPGVLTVAARVTRRLLDVFGVGLVLGHKEWAPGRKIDPAFDMGSFRSAVASLRDAQPTTTNLEELLMATSAFQLIGDGGMVYAFVPGQRAVAMGGLGNIHGTLNASGVAPVAGTVPQGELEQFTQRWDAAVA